MSWEALSRLTELATMPQLLKSVGIQIKHGLFFLPRHISDIENHNLFHDSLNLMLPKYCPIKPNHKKCLIFSGHFSFHKYACKNCMFGPWGGAPFLELVNSCAIWYPDLTVYRPNLSTSRILAIIYTQRNAPNYRNILKNNDCIKQTPILVFCNVFCWPRDKRRNLWISSYKDGRPRSYSLNHSFFNQTSSRCYTHPSIWWRIWPNWFEKAYLRKYRPLKTLAKSESKWSANRHSCLARRAMLKSSRTL